MVHFMMFILGINDIDLIAVEYFENCMKIKPINEFVKALFVVDFHWLRIKTEKANVIDIDSKTGKMTTVLKFFMILFFFLLFNLSYI